MKLRTVSLSRVARVTALLVVATAALATLAPIGTPASILLGGAFMLANFGLIRWLVSRLIRPGASKAAIAFALAAKLLLLLLLLAGVLLQLPVAPLSFAFGASMLLVAAVLEAVALGDEVGPLREVAEPSEH